MRGQAIQTQVSCRPVIAFLWVSLLISASAQADRFRYEPQGRTCEPKRFEAGSWIPIPESESAAYFNEKIQADLNQRKGDFARFKFRGAWHAVQVSCLIPILSANTKMSQKFESKVKDDFVPKFYLEFRGIFPFMVGESAGGGTSQVADATLTTVPYKPGLGFGASLGTWVGRDLVLGIDVTQNSGKQNVDIAGSVLGTVGNQVDLWRNYGLFGQYYFGSTEPAPSSLRVFVGAGIAYSNLNTDLTLGSLVVSASSNSLSFSGELGMVYALVPRVGLSLSTRYHYVGFDTAKVTASNNTNSIPINTELKNSIGYSNVSLALGVRISFD